MTPTIVSSSVPILIVLPGAFGLAPRYFCQNAWLTMTDDGAPGRSSSSTNERPSCGFTPNTVKKSRETDAERTRTGSLNPLTVTMLAGDVITIAEKLRACDFKSAKFGSVRLFRSPFLLV